MMPIQLRTFFAWFVLSDNFVLSFEIWNKFIEYFCESFSDNNGNGALLEIDDIFKLENIRCSDFRLPEPDENLHRNINLKIKKRCYSTKIYSKNLLHN